MQRRDFIASGLGALACAGISTAALAASHGGAGPGAQAYAALLGEKFIVYDGVRGETVRLVKVRQAPAQPGMQQFTLRFEGGRHGALPSGTYEVDHAATGKIDMFLDASARGADSVLYRADFSLLG